MMSIQMDWRMTRCCGMKIRIHSRNKRISCDSSKPQVAASDTFLFGAFWHFPFRCM